MSIICSACFRCAPRLRGGSGNQRATRAVLAEVPVKNTACPTIRERLAEARGRLERLDRERSFCGDPQLGKAVEQRIVWRELLDLELQDIDEQIERICEATRNMSGCRRTPALQKKCEPA